MHIVFEYGRTYAFEELPDNTVALDGAVQGPHTDAARRRYSFDHHGGCLRLVTLATCEQVLVALDLGLLVDRRTRVVLNDIDADTVLSVWLLRAAHYGNVITPAMRALVAQVGRVDAHGPVFEVHPLHPRLEPPHGKKQTREMLDQYLFAVDLWNRTGELPEAGTRDSVPGRGWGLRAAGGWVPVTTPDGFGPLYRQGFLAAALVREAEGGTLSWTIAKRSDLVPLPLGPADASKDRSGDFLPTILGELARLECAHGGSPRDTWGGGTSVGGSPRLPGGRSSILPEATVVTALQRFVLQALFD